MASSLPNLVDNLAKEKLKLNMNVEMIIKMVKRVELNTKIVSAASNTQTLKMV